MPSHGRGHALTALLCLQEKLRLAKEAAQEEENAELAEAAERERKKKEHKEQMERLAQLSATLPAAGQVRLDTTPGTVLTPSALKWGFMYKEGSKNTKFAERYFVLWRHPDLDWGAYHLVWFETADSLSSGAQLINASNVQIAPPKSRRKDFPNVFRLQVLHRFRLLCSDWSVLKNAFDRSQLCVLQTDDRKFILATDTPEEKAEWEAAFQTIKWAAPLEEKKRLQKEASDAAVR